MPKIPLSDHVYNLASTTTSEHDSALRAVKKATPAEVIPLVENRLKLGDPKAVWKIILALGKLKNPEYFPVISKAHKMEHGALKIGAIRAMILADTPHFHDTIVNAAIHGSLPVRAAAKMEISDLRNNSVLVAKILEQTSDPSQYTWAINLLSRKKGQSISLLASGLTNQSPYARAEILHRLAKYRDSSAHEHILKGLEDVDTGVRITALVSLAKLKGVTNPAIFSKLMEVFQSGEKRLHSSALNAMLKLHPQYEGNEHDSLRRFSLAASLIHPIENRFQFESLLKEMGKTDQTDLPESHWKKRANQLLS